MGRVCKERLETLWLGTGLGTRSREVERLNKWNPSNLCMHGQRTLNDNDDDDDDLPLSLRRSLYSRMVQQSDCQII